MTSKTGSWRTVVLCLAMVLGPCGSAVAEPVQGREARVVVLNGSDPNLPAFLAMDAEMRSRLAEEPGPQLTVFSETLDAQRFPAASLEQEHLALFAKKYRAVRVDVVVAITKTALDFFLRHGQDIWPGARVVYAGYPGEEVEPSDLPPGGATVLGTQAVEATLALATRMQPDARRVVVVAGSSALDASFERLARDALATRYPHLQHEFLVGLPLPELVGKVGGLPPDTIVLYLSQFRDRSGTPLTPREVLRTFSQASAAPVYGTSETFIGSGAVAGAVELNSERGRLIAEQVRVALAGGSVVPPATRTQLRCIADARALQRWSLPERRLPDDCELRYATPSLWRDYFWQSLAALALLGLQTLLIAGLLIQRSRRRSAEAESRKRFSEMTHMNRRVVLGEISASIAHELNQPLGAIRNNAGAAELMLKADPPRLDDVAEILDDIKRDDQRASQILGRIRKMLVKSEFRPQDTDLNALIADTIDFLREETGSRGASVELELDPQLAAVRADPVEIRQVLVNLVLNAVDAMQGQPVSQRRIVVRSRRTETGQAEVVVQDSGEGIAEHLLPRIFEGFVTSKAQGMGLGLTISRTIVEAHGGKIRAASRPEGGASMHFTLPLAGGNADE